MEEQIDTFHNFVAAPINGATFRGNDSGWIINRNSLLHTESDVIFEPVRTQ